MTAAAVTLSLAATSAAPYAARHGVVDGLLLEGRLAERAALLTSEAVTNSVLHAGLEPSELVHVDAWWAGDGIRVEVCDAGGGLDGPSAAEPRDGGRGLLLIDRLSERWGVRHDAGTHVWFELAG